MTCPYCGKRVKDMPSHLELKPVCHEKHVQKLQDDLKYIMFCRGKNSNRR